MGNDLMDKLNKEATVTIPMSLYNKLLEESRKYNQIKELYDKGIRNDIPIKSVNEVKSEENDKCIWIMDKTYKGYYTTSCRMYYLPTVAKQEYHCPNCNKPIVLDKE